ncbi:MAG: hypothetical protein B7Y56_03385 [Gallionellales bacterium 35-53-114]|jgi:hypothetical protein|nr:MAG: hypothetical protein B7Y56_03385 [Gallionellales bacterium 35-53-114]OYZ65148.1 MAG: hypothetical protein B7Y04_00545 [Gallionellales bacterium 24-53-125]OZB08056.1 MAG: hypothetical protein B7X61_10995 [Gallionellales bacterium 39-52-133]HQS59960.1 phage tail protein [Gallionellaceae bacterium]HQS76658.1 phage tail protein [Gallionellaceae bacterium]
MTAISKTWQAITDAQIDPDSPIDAALMQAIRDGLVHLREWIGAGYVAGAVQDHNHDGVNSAPIPIGANSLRNGSFEGNSTAGWTLTPYTGGSLAASAAVYMHGIYSLAITSTILANGGGGALTDEYEEVTGGGAYTLKGSLKASIAGVSCKVEIIWYDDAQAQISAYSVYSSISTPTTQVDFDTTFFAPATAKYKRLNLVGGVPASGSAVGTIYFDGLHAARSIGMLLPGDVIYTAQSTAREGFLKCNGAAVSRLAYAGLFTAIGTTHGAGDGSTTFNLPELRGEFIRCLADGRAVDTGRALGSYQAGQNESHSHSFSHSLYNYSGAGSGTNYTGVDGGGGYAGDVGTGTSASGGGESRPRNVALLACIKY